MDERLVEQIQHNLDGKSSDELLKVWQQNDHQSWSSEAFEAIRRILTQREILLPVQQMPSQTTPSDEDSTHKSGGLLLYRLFLLLERVGFCIVVLVIFTAATLASGDAIAITIYTVVWVIYGLYLFVRRSSFIYTSSVPREMAVPDQSPFREPQHSTPESSLSLFTYMCPECHFFQRSDVTKCAKCGAKNPHRATMHEGT